MDDVGLNQFSTQVAAFGAVVTVITIIIGIVMVMYGLYSMTDTAQKRKPIGMGSSVTTIGIGGMFIALSTLINIGTASVFGPGGGHDIRGQILVGEAYTGADAGGDASAQFAAAVNFGFTIVALVGLIGFIRGWMILNNIAKNGSSPGSTAGHAITLIIGGILALNIPATVILISRAISIPWLEQIVSTIT